MRFSKFSLVVFLLSAGVVGAAVIDNAEQLYVPLGETYTLYGTHSYSGSVVIEGTVYVTGYSGAAGTGTLELVASDITVSGTIDGNDRGYRTGEGFGAGSWPGGGGAYGGNGGASGWGNPGGTAYGTADGADIDMGSGGASQTGGVGGPGGASVSLFANTLTISGLITVNGSQGTDIPGFGDGGGGGAGGGILVKTISVTISGTLSANGLRGGNSQRRGGGGGGGGRIKIFYGTLNKAGMSYSASGGAGGSGPSGNGSAGASGTYYEAPVIFDDAENLYVPAGFIYDMSGTHQYSNSAVIAGQVNITAYDGTVETGILELIAPEIIVSGTINGNERGYRGNLYDEGPGCGGYPGGGGGYGGRGGDSGSGGTGSGPYGTTEHIDIDMGSAGGDAGGGGTGGGDGGAVMILNADILTIEGTLTTNGSIGLSPTSWAAGGGSGGGILLLVDQAQIGGTLSANGGAGGSSTWGGGGGAGGRIKIFYNAIDTTGATFTYSGGAGGAGSWSGQAGGIGTLYMGRNMRADLNHDGIVNFLDMAILSIQWLDSP